MANTTPFRNILDSVHLFSRNKKYMWHPKNIFACVPIFITIFCNAMAVLYVSLLFQGGFNINALPLRATAHYILDNVSDIQFIHILPYVLYTGFFVGITILAVLFVLKKIHTANNYYTLKTDVPYAINTQDIDIPDKITWCYKNSAPLRKQPPKGPYTYQNMSVPLNPVAWYNMVKPCFYQSIFLFCILIPILQIMFMVVSFITALTLDSLATQVFNFTYIMVLMVLFVGAIGLIYVGFCTTMLATDSIYKKTCKWVENWHHPHSKIYTLCQHAVWAVLINIILISAYLITVVFLISVVAIAIHFIAYKSLFISIITSLFGFIIFSIIAYVIAFSAYVTYAISAHLAMTAYLDITAQDNCTNAPFVPQTFVPPTDNDNQTGKIYTLYHPQQKTD